VTFYRDFLLPRLCHLSMRNRRLLPYRQRIVARAEGRVLEIGMGSGLNLPFYGAGVSEIVGLDPSANLLAIARRSVDSSAIPVDLLEASAEAIPLGNRSVDTIVMTWTLCSIPEAAAAVAEMRRVLRPSGKLLFVEHGLAPDKAVRWWQDTLSPAWKRLSGGCHLNRPIRAMIEEGGFRIDRLDTAYMPGPKPMTFMYEGSASPR
jgi:ubiquinone/menaquinone biosynthesis C-methylase UbiE